MKMFSVEFGAQVSKLSIDNGTAKFKVSMSMKSLKVNKVKFDSLITCMNTAGDVEVGGIVLRQAQPSKLSIDNGTCSFNIAFNLKIAENEGLSYNKLISYLNKEAQIIIEPYQESLDLKTKDANKPMKKTNNIPIENGRSIITTN